MNPSAIALVVLAFGLAGCSGGEAGSSMSGQPPVDAERIAHERDPDMPAAVDVVELIFWMDDERLYADVTFAGPMNPDMYVYGIYFTWDRESSKSGDADDWSAPQTFHRGATIVDPGAAPQSDWSWAKMHHKHRGADVQTSFREDGFRYSFAHEGTWHGDKDSTWPGTRVISADVGVGTGKPLDLPDREYGDSSGVTCEYDTVRSAHSSYGGLQHNVTDKKCTSP